ncbi:MAG: TrkA C-terminal domain-containing protein, partial [bacterium]
EAEALVGPDRSGLVVVNDLGEFMGLATREAIQRAAAEKRRQLRVGDLLLRDDEVLAPDDPLDHALEYLTERGMNWAPVVERGRVLGQLTVRDIVRAYKSMLRRGIRRISSLAPHTSLFEVRVAPGSPLAGRTLREANLPRDTLVISISRNGEMIFPRADTRIEAGDVVAIMADPRSEPSLRAYFSSSDPRDER